MNRTSWGFVLAAAYNSGIVPFSLFFSNNLGSIDPLFGPGGCIGILLWGMAYLALTHTYAKAPAVSLVFCLEKAFYFVHWCLWMSTNAGTLPTLLENDPLTGLFFAIYGVGDALFMIFFGWVAWTYRDNLWPKPASE